jgi:hypothetical protein
VDNTDEDAFVIAEGSALGGTEANKIRLATDDEIQLVCYSDHVYSTNRTGAKFMLDINPAWMSGGFVANHTAGSNDLGRWGFPEGGEALTGASYGGINNDENGYFWRATSASGSTAAIRENAESYSTRTRPLVFSKFRMGADNTNMRWWHCLSYNTGATIVSDDALGVMGLRFSPGGSEAIRASHRLRIRPII